MQRKKNEYFEIFLETLSNEVKFLWPSFSLKIIRFRCPNCLFARLA